MILYLKAKTNIPDAVVDLIDVKLKSGETVSLNWEESEIVRNNPDYSAKYKGVCFDEEYANGRISELEDLEITRISLFSETDSGDFEITELKFEDGDDTLEFTNVGFIKNCGGDDCG